MAGKSDGQGGHTLFADQRIEQLTRRGLIWLPEVPSIPLADLCLLECPREGLHRHKFTGLRLVLPVLLLVFE